MEVALSFLQFRPYDSTTIDLKTLFTVFETIFAIELGDKAQFDTLRAQRTEMSANCLSLNALLALVVV
jgi:putative Ca2+/H+ antiporter (TMEM165/GDT1 family)